MVFCPCGLLSGVDIFSGLLSGGFLSGGLLSGIRILVAKNAHLKGSCLRYHSMKVAKIVFL